MELDIKDLVQTMAVGAFVLFSLSLFFWILKQQIPFLPAFGLPHGKTNAPAAGAAGAKGENAAAPHPQAAGEGIGSHKIELHMAAVYVALSFAIGIIAEGLCGHVFYQRESEPEGLDFFRLKNNKELRFSHLFEKPVFENKHLAGDAAPLLEDLLGCPGLETNVLCFRTSLLTNLDGTNRAHKLDLHDTNRIREFKLALNAMFYAAKNRSFREQTYYAELSDIQNRIVFVRSFIFICFVFAYLFYLACLVLSLAALFKPDQMKALGLTRAHIVRAMALATLYFLSWKFGNVAYEEETRNFDNRAIGYYISLKTDPGK